MMMPTARAALLFAGGVPVALLAVAIAPELWSLSADFSILVLVAVAADALLALPPRRIALLVRPPNHLVVGQGGVLVVEVQKMPYRRRARLEIRLEQRGDLDETATVPLDVPAGSGAAASIALTARRRGQVMVDAVWVRWNGPLSLIRFVRRIPLDAVIDVISDIRGVHNAALQFFARDAILGVKVQHQQGEGTEFEALREYAPGLDSRRVDWKRSARHRKLLCKEFETERNHHIILAFDTGYLMREPVNKVARLDHAINAGLVLSWIALRSGDLVGTYGFDAVVRSYQAPARGLYRFSHLQRATAGLAYNAEETNYTLGLAELNVRLRRRTLVILFTEFVDTVTAELLIESLERLRNRHVVVLVTLRDNELR
ncbi:MAG: DUF58 domain-containing protein, partial [Bradyrhizobiaceae bacterium]|nr:DUF58 domain-containing protein [Bradyrhizobiaceae bacterium]